MSSKDKSKKEEPKDQMEVPKEKKYKHPWKESGPPTQLGAENLVCGRCGLSATSDTKDSQDKLACKGGR